MNAPPPSALTSRPAWAALTAHYEQIRHQHLRQLFTDDPVRGTRLVAEAAGLYLDYSKHRVTDETLGLLLALAKECRLQDRIAAMFAGERINVTERRPALLRRAGLAAPAHVVAIVQGAHDLGLVQLAQDAAAMDDRVLAGAIALDLGRRSLAPDQLRAVSAALGSISFPEVAELNDFFKQMRDLYLTSALEALDLAPPEDSSSALKRMTWGRERDQPVLRLDPEGMR